MRALSARLRLSVTLVAGGYVLCSAIPAAAEPESTENGGGAYSRARAAQTVSQTASEPAGSRLPASLQDVTKRQVASGPRLSNFTRRVPPRASPLPTAPSAEAERIDVSATTRPAHQRGRPPTSPSARLPDDVTPAQPSAAVRRLVTGAPATPDVAPDPSFVALAEAEALLFPDVRGSRLQERTPLGSQASLRGTTELYATGSPPLRRTPAAGKPELSESDSRWLASLRLPDFSARLDARVVKYLKFYRDTERGRAIIKIWTKRSGRYAPALKAYLARVGLPQDLAWLSLIESGHDPTIRSHAGALGLWQFMPGTARMYGLTVDRWVDERLDPERSTQAAARFLSDLYQRFGSWELAMAGYNMGYGGLSRAIRKYNTNDFWLLSSYEAGIPWETALYVPKIIAICIVMNNKAHFGVADITPETPEDFDTILVGSGMSLENVALAADMPLAELKRFNPQYRAGHTPPQARASQRFRIHLPPGLGKTTHAKLTRPTSGTALTHYKSRFGDTLITLARERGIGVEELVRLNPFEPDEALATGSSLWLPRAASKARPTQETPTIAASPALFSYPAAKRVFYTARAGDTLASIARSFSVSRAAILLWNQVDARAKLQPGQVLQLFIDKRRDLAQIRYLPANQVEVLETGSENFYDHQQARQGRVRLVIRARPGDTLLRIGRRYGIRASSMERINQKSRRQVLSAGEPIVVYVKGWRAAKSPDQTFEPGPIPLPQVEAAHPELLPNLEPQVEASTESRSPFSSLAP